MTFSIHFLLCNVVITVLLGLIFLLKRIFKRSLTLSSQYHIWHIFLLALFLPFIPYRFLNPNQFLGKLQSLFSSKSANMIRTSMDSASNTAVSTKLGFSDFAESINDSTASALGLVFHTLWIAGCVITFLYFVYNIYKIYAIKKSAYFITLENEAELYQHYLSCVKELNIKRKVSLYASCRISSPVSYGLIRPTIIIPQDLDILLQERDIRFIFLHELQHYKHKDAILNYVSCILQIVYWFNPFIWYAFRIMRKDREIACDHSVIQTVGKEQAVHYGYTLIRYAEKLQKNAFLSPLSRLGGEKAVIVQRLKEIADFKSETLARKLKSICILSLAALLIYTASPLLTSYAFSEDACDLPQRNTEDIDLSSYFQGRKGSFVLYDIEADHYQIYNKALSAKRVSPDSTFKIYSGLFALEEGVISPDSSTQTWDGTDYSFDSWNKDQTLLTAMQNSVNWYFQDLDSQLGNATLAAYYRQISYGNCDLSSGIDHYWAESSLKISPAEQVILLSDLLQNKWGFQEENIQAVKNALYLSDTSFGTLYGKTGTGSFEGSNVNGWFVGFLENDGRVYCFATNIQDSEDACGSTAADITLNILKNIL